VTPDIHCLQCDRNGDIVVTHL